MTEAQRKAFYWFKQRGGDASRQGHARQQILCAGEIAPFMWTTFKALMAMGFVETYDRYRIRLTQAGKNQA